MGSEDRFDVQAGEKVGHRVLVHVLLPEASDGGSYRFRQRLRVGLSLALPQDAHAVVIFGDVDEVEVAGKGAGHVFGLG